MARTRLAGTNNSMMSARKSSRTALGSLVAIGLIAGFAHTATAQEANVARPQEIFQDQQTRDPFSSRGGDQAGGVMDLVHRAMQAGSLSSEDFTSEQKDNLDSATAAFRAAQKQRLTGSQTAPAIVPNPSTAPAN